MFTPLNLVRELLYGLRKSDLEDGNQVIWGVDESGNCFDDDAENRVGGIPLELWRDPETKWLDPANGIGNFPFVAFHMLDFQLKHHGTKGAKEMPDDERKKHIVNQMLYMIEIDKGNVNTSYKVMDYLAPGSKPRICCADTLKVSDDDLMRHFGVNRFNVVMGNPPFQTPTIGKRVGGYGGRTLWDKFVKLSLSLIGADGYLVFITPAMWRKPDADLWSTMTQTNQLMFLHIVGEKESQDKFHVSQRVDLYILKNSTISSIADVIDEKRISTKIDMKQWNFLPNYEYDSIQKILTAKESGINVQYSASTYDSRKLSKTPTETFKYPVVHGVNQSGLTILYANDNTKPGHFGTPKVILSFGRHQYPYNDHEGKYGMSQITFGIPISSKEEGDAIVEAMNTDSFKEIIKATKWGAFQTDYKMFKYFRPDFYKEFLKKPEEVAKRKTVRAVLPVGGRRTRRVSIR